jgi:putative FmdB family regulatory protein
MPLYEYECEACGHRFEKIQKYSDPLADTCPKCGAGPVRKLFSSPAIQFKGSGFYITDYAKKDGGKDAKDGGKDAKKDGGKDGKAGAADAKETKGGGDSTTDTKAGSDTAKDTKPASDSKPAETKSST